jgi:hypothetical protein
MSAFASCSGTGGREAGPKGHPCPFVSNNALLEQITDTFQNKKRNPKVPYFIFNGARDWTRTSIPHGATTSRWCVYQFHHPGKVELI